MASYSINLPLKLQQQVEQCAVDQGVSLDQFILWAITEKVAVLQHQSYDSAFPQITYRQGASSQPVPIIRGTGIRVQTVVIATHQWEMSPHQLAEEYGVSESQITEALEFYQTHQTEIDSMIVEEQALESASV